jgi:hypothetical protein
VVATAATVYSPERYISWATFSQAAEPDPALGQAGHGIDKMAQGPAEAVEFPTTRVSPGRS